MIFSRYFIIVSAFLLFGFSSFAQIDLGLKLGANYNMPSYKVQDGLKLDFNNKASFQGGAFLRLKVKAFHFQIETLFTTHNAEIGLPSSLNAIDEDLKTKFSTIDVPLIVGLRLLNFKVAKLRVNAGVIPSFNVSSYGDLKKNSYKDVYYSGVAGISLDIPIFVVDVRYQWSLNDYYESPQISGNSYSLGSNMLTLSVGLRII